MGSLKKLYKANKTYIDDDVNLIKMIDDFLVAKHLKRMGRKSTLFHPSVISKGISCERYWYYTFLEDAPEAKMVKRESFGARTLKIMEVGTGIHWAFHGVLYEMGILEGVWKCRSCSHKFWATSPKKCPSCEAELKWEMLTFKEIPFRSQYIAGHADGILNFESTGTPIRMFLEMKSIKSILDKSANKHTYGFESLEQPIEEHDLQLQLYMDEWQNKVKECHNKEILVVQKDGTYKREPNIGPDVDGARIVGPLTTGLIVYIGKNNSEMKTFVTHLNPQKIKFLKTSMVRIFEAVATGDFDNMGAKCYTSNCQKDCKFGDKCKEDKCLTP